MSERQEDINRLLLDPSFRNWALKTDARDHQHWKDLLAQDPDLLPIAEEARRVVLEIELKDYPRDHDQSILALQRLKGKMHQLQKPETVELPISKGNGTGRIKQIVGVFLRAAAIILFFMAAGLVVHRTVTKNANTSEHEIRYVEKRTTDGQQLSVKMPDGTSIKLNNNSLLRVPENYSADRRVILEGEAFFDVARDEYLPFRIHTGNILIEVLGTSFNVQASEEAQIISVVSGKVRVKDTVSNSATTEAILHEREAVVYNTATNVLESVQYNHDDLLWKDGILVFRDESIQEIEAKLERWFNVEITLHNEQFIGGHYTAKYPKESLEEILIGMGAVLNFDFEINNNHVVLTGKPQQL